MPSVCFVLRLAPTLSSRQVVDAPRWYVASCAFIGIVSQGLARSYSVDLSVFPQTKAKRVVGLHMDAKNGFFRPRFVRERSIRLPLLLLNRDLVFTSLGETKQPCFRLLSDWILVRFF